MFNHDDSWLGISLFIPKQKGIATKPCEKTGLQYPSKITSWNCPIKTLGSSPFCGDPCSNTMTNCSDASILPYSKIKRKCYEKPFEKIWLYTFFMGPWETVHPKPLGYPRHGTTWQVHGPAQMKRSTQLARDRSEGENGNWVKLGETNFNSGKYTYNISILIYIHTI